MKQGKFITLEGCEGAGKSLQLKLLKEYFDKNSIDYIYTREPGGAEISEKIRAVILDANNKDMHPVTEALLFAAARVQHIESVILPALKQGKIVLCDRYIDSSFAYQAYAGGLGYDYIAKINDRAITTCMPDITLFLNISPADAFKRKGGADANDRIEQNGLVFHEKVYAGYLEMLKKSPERIVAIDCMGERKQTHLNILSALKERGIIG